MGMDTDYSQIVELWLLPIENPEATFTAEYSGDCANNPSSGSGEISSKWDSKVDGYFVPGDSSNPPSVLVTVSSADPSNNRIPTGTIELTLDHSGSKCRVFVQSGGNVSYGECEGTASYVSRTDNSVTFRYTPNRISAEDVYLSVMYGGDPYFKSSQKSIKLSQYPLRLIPEKIYSDARAYFNMINSGKLYPRYPERFSDPYAACNSASASSGDCQTPLNDLSLNIRAETGSDAPQLPSDAVVTVSGSGISTQCTLVPVSTGVYSCRIPSVSFNSPGLYSLTAAYAGDELFASTSVKIEDIYVIRIPNQPTETGTAFLSPQGNTIYASPGETITVTAEAFEKDYPVYKIGSPQFIFYTYDWTTNERIQTCYGTTCSLEITSNTSHVYAEFVGNDRYAPSSTYKLVRSGPASASGLSAQSPVSISVALIEP